MRDPIWTKGPSAVDGRLRHPGRVASWDYVVPAPFGPCPSVAPKRRAALGGLYATRVTLLTTLGGACSASRRRSIRPSGPQHLKQQTR